MAQFSWHVGGGHTVAYGKYLNFVNKITKNYNIL